MSLLDTILNIFAPHDCLGCNAEGSLLCPACQRALPLLPGMCFRCGLSQYGYMLCEACRSTSSLQTVRAAVAYSHIAKSLVWNLKFAGAQAAVRPMASVMAPLLPEDRELIIVPVPTATSRIRRRGYDQTRLLARELARRTGLPTHSLLTRRGQARQVGASRRQRLTQLQSAFYCQADLKNATILLIDDVLTTGATLEAAALTLVNAGAREVSALTFARSEPEG